MEEKKWIENLFMVTNLPKKKVLKAHNLCASWVYTKAIIYFNVGKNRRKKGVSYDPEG